MKKTKLLVIIELFTPNLGGMERLFLELCQSLSQQYDITVLTTRSDSRSSLFECRDGFKIKRVPFKSRYLFTFLAPFYGYKLAKQADLIQTTTYNGALAAWLLAKLFNKPVVITVLEAIGTKWFQVRWLNKLSQLAYYYFEKLILSLKFSHFICISKSTAKDLDKIKNHKRVSVVYPSFRAIKQPEKINLYQLYKIDPKKKIIIYFGRPGYLKGLDYLTSFIRKLKNSNLFFLFILGQNPKQIRDEIIKTAATIKNLKVIGSLPKIELFCHIASAAVIVPSLNEGFGYSALEASYLAPNLISSNQGSLPEVVFGKVVYYNPVSYLSFTNAINKFKQSDFQEIPEHSFRPDQVSTSYHRIYQQLINKRKSE